MRQALFSSRMKNLYTQRNLLLALMMGLVASNVILGFVALVKQETIILVPPEINRTLTFTSKQPSPSYLEEMSVFFARVVLDNSAQSFGYSQDLILRYASPAYFGTLKKQLMEVQERYTKESLSTHFRPLEVVVISSGQPTDESAGQLAADSSGGKLQASVTGELETFVGGTRVSSTKETFVITYGYKNGFLSITSFQSHTGVTGGVA